jgi:hypothetical protein
MPKPKKFLTNSEIEERAAEVLDMYVKGGRERPILPIDIDTLTECDFGFKVTWETLDDPEGCRTFATLYPTPGDIHSARLLLNSRFRRFLESQPEIERLTRGHELCHWVIHVDDGKLKTGSLPFDEPEPPIRYHRLQYVDNTLTSEMKNRLAVFALEDERAYRVLKPHHGDQNAWIEPEWMHRQAEHFSACLLVPRQPLLRLLNDGANPSFYGTHVRLAEKFVVSKRVVQIRLIKLGIIEQYGPGQFRNLVTGGSRLFRA